MTTNFQELFLSSIWREEPYRAISSGEDLTNRDTFNSRMRPLVSRMNEVMRNMTSISTGDPRFIAELFRFHANPVFEKTFNYENIEAYKYSSFFDNEGQVSGLPSNVIILAMSEAGRLPESEFKIVLFDKEGLLVNDSEYYVRNTQDGCNIFFRMFNSVTGDAQISNNEDITVVAMRKFYTPSEPQRFLKTLTADDISGEGATGLVEYLFEGTYESPLGPLVDTRYVKVFYKPFGLSHYLAYPENKYNVVLNSDGEAKVSIDLSTGVGIGDQICIVNGLEWNELEFTYSLNEDLEFLLKSEGDNNTFDLRTVSALDLTFIPLVNLINGSVFPSGITDAKDIHLWIDGMHLTPEVDYSIIFKNNIGYGIYLEKELILGDNVRVYAICNEPYVPEMVYEHKPTLGDDMVIKLNRDVGYILNGGGLCFANNRHISVQHLTPISERHVVFEKTCSKLNIEVRLSFLATRALIDTLALFESYGSEFSRIMALSPEFEANFLTTTFAEMAPSICPNNPMQLGYAARSAFGGMMIANDNMAMNEDTNLSGTLLLKDTELGVTFIQNSTTTNGALTIDSSGGFTYSPIPNFFGTDEFEVTVREITSGIERRQTIVFTIANVDDATILSTSSFSTPEDTPLSSQLLYVDIDSSTITFSVKRAPSFGTLNLNASNGGFIFTPNVNYFGSDSFEVFMTDENGNDSVGTVNLTITPVNDAPYITNTTFNTVENGSLVDTLLTSDVENQATVVALVSSGANGNAVIQPTGAFTYTPDANFSGQDQFVAEVEDASGAKRTHTITVNVNDLPVLNTSTFSMNEDNVLNSNLVSTDSNGIVTYAIETQPTSGSLTLSPSGAFTFTPTANYNGVDKFTVKLTDTLGATRDSEVNVSIQPVNDVPSIITKQFDAILNLQLVGAFTFHDVDGDPVTPVLSTQATSGVAVVNNDGTFTYTPNPDFRGDDSFFVQVSDGKGGTAVETIQVTVDTTAMFDFFLAGAGMVANNEGDIVVSSNTDDTTDFIVDSNVDLPLDYTENAILDGNDDETLSANYILEGNGSIPAPQ